MPNGCQPATECLSLLVIFGSTPSQKGVEGVQEDVEFVDIGSVRGRLRAKARPGPSLQNDSTSACGIPGATFINQRFSHLTVTRCYVRPATARLQPPVAALREL